MRIVNVSLSRNYFGDIIGRISFCFSSIPTDRLPCAGLVHRASSKPAQQEGLSWSSQDSVWNKGLKQPWEPLPGQVTQPVMGERKEVKINGT